MNKKMNLNRLINVSCGLFLGAALAGCGGGEPEFSSVEDVEASSQGRNQVATQLRITSEPVDQSAQVGQTATFRVGVNLAAGALSYQWFRNGVAIDGGTGSSYTTPELTIADSDSKYSVTVKSGSQFATSRQAVLKVGVVAPTPMLVISTQPGDQAVDAGQAATFSVLANASPGAITYQWFKNGTAITGATASTYTTPATVQTDDGATYSVMVKSDVLSQTSAQAVLKVNTLDITTEPNDQSVDLGTPASFSVVAKATYSPVTYQWFRNGTAILGATKSTYTTPDTTLAANSAKYTVIVRSGTLSKTSREIALRATGKLPHTGITDQQCYQKGTDAWSSCADQAVLTLNGQQDGHRVNINPMSYSLVIDGSTGQTYSKEECVKDNVTGLIWEGKTVSGTRASNNTYAHSSSLGYVSLVNGTKLCGYSDWRLPSERELSTIVDCGAARPSIKNVWFPYTPSGHYWTSSIQIGSTNTNPIVWAVSFVGGDLEGHSTTDMLYVRLVRGRQP